MNIRSLASVGGALALVSAIVTANLWRELHAERELIAGLRTQLAQATAGTGAAPAARIDLGSAAPVAIVPAEPEKPTASPVAATAVREAVTVVSPFVGSSINEQDLLKDPEYRKARLTMLRSTMRQNYPGLVEELGLNSEEADRLFNLLAENQMAMTSRMPDLANPGQDPAAMDAFRRSQQALQRQQADSLTALLGNAKYAQWQEYQQTRPARLQANNYATTLAQAGSPLDSAQLKSVVSAVVAEQKSARQDFQAVARQIDQEAMQNRQAESNRRVLEAVTPYLTAQQLNALRTQFEQQDAINRAARRAREAMQRVQP